MRSASQDGLLPSSLERALCDLLPGVSPPRLPQWERPPALVPPRQELLRFPAAVERALRRRFVGIRYRLRLRWFRREVLVVGDRLVAGPEREEFVAWELEREDRSWARLAPALPDPGVVAEELVQDLERDGATGPPPGRYSLLLSPAAAGVLLHEALGHGSEVDWGIRGGFDWRPGQRVAGARLSVHEDPTAAPPGAERAADDEGVPCGARWLLREGRLESRIADRAACEQMDDAGPGQGFRASRHDPVLPRTYCLRALPGDVPFEDLERAARGGIAVLELGRGTVDVANGMLRLEVASARELTARGPGNPLGSFEIRAPVAALLGAIVGVGSEPQTRGGWCAKRGQKRPSWVEAPPLLLEGVEVFG